MNVVNRRPGLVARIAVAATVAGVLALSVAPGGAGARAPAGTGLPAPGAVTELPYLHVVVPPPSTVAPDRTPYLAEPTGSQVMLRGVAVVGLQDVAYPGADGRPALFAVSPSAYDGKCPKASPLIPQPPLCEVEAAKPAYRQSTAPGSGDDLAEMRAMGFNVIRLVLNWSQLEPTPGDYSTTYLARVAQVVGWARQQGIYVILDMHEDQYSRYILPAAKPTTVVGLKCTPSGGSDGAPKWAVFTDTKPACAIDGQSALNPASSAAFYNFWHNHPVAAPKGQAPGTGLEDHYIGALAALAKRFAGTSTVLGYELMNEPQTGSLTALPLENLYQSASQDLYPFYKRAIEALTGVRDGLPTCPSSAPTSLTDTCAYPQLAHVSKQQIFFEPLADRNLVDFSPQVSAPFSSYPNLVYAPHVYTHAFTVDQFLGYKATDSPYPPTYTFGYQTAEAEADGMHAAVFTTEYGDSAGTDSTVAANETAAQESTLTGGTLWAWKGLSTKETACWCVRWQYSSYHTTSDGTPGSGNPRAPVSSKDELIPSRAALLERVYPEETVGRLLAYQYDPTTRAFVMEGYLTAGSYKGSTVVSIPAAVHGSVQVTSGAGLTSHLSVVKEPDGTRLAYASFATSVPMSTATTTGLTAAHEYRITVGTPSAASAAAVEAAATQPLQPIIEPTARAVAEQALQNALSSPTPQIKGTASLANALAGILLGPTDPNPPH
jgi:endoglycosylceramidase